jgi:hypothetical protein
MLHFFGNTALCYRLLRVGSVPAKGEQNKIQEEGGGERRGRGRLSIH